MAPARIFGSIYENLVVMKILLSALFALSLISLTPGNAFAHAPFVSWGELMLPAGTTQAQCNDAAQTALHAAGFAAVAANGGQNGAWGMDAANKTIGLVLCETALGQSVWFMVTTEAPNGYKIGDPNNPHKIWFRSLHDTVERMIPGIRSVR